MGFKNDTAVNIRQPASETAVDARHPDLGEREETSLSYDENTVEHSTDYEQKHIQSVKLKLAVLARRLGEPLDTDIYYGNKLIARQGQATSGNLVMQLRGFDPLHLNFTNEGVRRLNTK